MIGRLGLVLAVALGAASQLSSRPQVLPPPRASASAPIPTIAIVRASKSESVKPAGAPRAAVVLASR